MCSCHPAPLTFSGCRGSGSRHLAGSRLFFEQHFVFQFDLQLGGDFHKKRTDGVGHAWVVYRRRWWARDSARQKSRLEFLLIYPI